MALDRTRQLIIPVFAVIALSASALAWAGGFLGGLVDAWGTQYSYVAGPAALLLPYRPPPPVDGDAANSVRRWNQIALDANAIDHTPPESGETRIFGEQLGSARTARAFAVVDVARFVAAIGIDGGY